MFSLPGLDISSGSAKASGSPVRVLLIAEDPQLARLLREGLTKDPEFLCELRTAARPNESLDLVEKAQVDLILFDLPPTGLHGFDALARTLARSHGIPVVVLATPETEELAIRAVARGADDYVVIGSTAGVHLVRAARAALQRNLTVARLRTADRLRSQFVSTASHEMRTPLAIIREFIALARDGTSGPVTATQAECLDGAMRNCDRLTALVNDLLDVARIESGEVKVYRGKVDPASLLRQCHEDFGPQFRSGRQTLQLQAPEGLPEVIGDRPKIQQVLVNLIGNARKFTPEGGCVEVGAVRDGAMVRFFVQDDGIGIAAEHQPMIFEAFTQIARDERPGVKGTGLGLAISR
ncbi:MAG TPA: ATP-binding protein [Candidatus Polarisedimenticolia bacterium]|jgi:signal transduction histidine kinase|nr:ATP-binding protein [Candidatus Polarisedimenticolia bacterium]